MSYRLIDHTADFGIIVSGKTPEALFTNAGLSLTDLITDTSRLTGREDRKIWVSGDDWPDLMVNWLRELLYLWNGNELLVSHVSIDHLTETGLSARVQVEPFDPACHAIRHEIKAVTYHQIQVSSSADGWTSTIIFDV